MAQMQLTNAQIINIMGTCKELMESKDKLPVKFGYWLGRISAALKPVCATIEELQKSTPEFVEYQVKRVRLATEYADKNKEGQPIVDGENYRIQSRRPEWESEFNRLKQEYSDVLDSQRKRLNELQGLLNETVEVECPQLKLSQYPEELEGVYQSALLPITEDD